MLRFRNMQEKLEKVYARGIGKYKNYGAKPVGPTYFLPRLINFPELFYFATFRWLMMMHLVKNKIEGTPILKLAMVKIK